MKPNHLTWPVIIAGLLFSPLCHACYYINGTTENDAWVNINLSAVNTMATEESHATSSSRRVLAFRQVMIPDKMHIRCGVNEGGKPATGAKGYRDMSLMPVSAEHPHYYQLKDITTGKVIDNLGLAAGWNNSPTTMTIADYPVKPYAPSDLSGIAAGDYRLTQNVAVEIAAFGPLKPGRYLVDLSRFNADWFYGNEGKFAAHTVPLIYLRFNPLTINVSVTGCDLITENQQVKLDTLSTSDFTGNYSTSNVGHFSLDFSHCDRNIGIYYRFTKARSSDVENDPAGLASSVLKNQEGDQFAKGLGIQILPKDSNTPVIFDGAESLGVARTTGDLASVPFDLRYVKTGGKVEGGMVKATAAFEVYYR
ncbi:fimbrial protein [Enterobacter sp.]|uniref:fimbrial protein n=1 Tax=Enterobacter sp. TaxID=42895 RepID=UPI00298298CD|nr:fimbrial protein [Enterobacter sp.]